MFNADGRYVAVTGIPSTVCRNCGERSFRREATKRARLLVHDPQEGAPAKSVPMQFYEFACPAPRGRNLPKTRKMLGIHHRTDPPPLRLLLNPAAQWAGLKPETKQQNFLVTLATGAGTSPRTIMKMPLTDSGRDGPGLTVGERGAFCAGVAERVNH